MKLAHLVNAAFMLLSTPVFAQSATDPVSGRWSGDIGLNHANRHPVTFDLKFDGKSAISGTVTGPGPAQLRSGSFDPQTGAFKLEVEVGDGTPSRMIFDGFAVKGMATGRVTDGNQSGTFRLTIADAQKAAAIPSGITADVTRQGFAEVSGWVSKAADMVSADMYRYRPAATVRTFGQLVGHIADAYNYFCGRATGQNVQWSDAIANGKTDKATVVAKLRQSLEVCNAAHTSNGTAPPLLANIAHTNLHYGNIVTYMRMMQLVPPSS
jgi:DinB family protein